MNDDTCENRTLAAWGTHMILEEGLIDKGKGILISATSDGWLVFVLPYKGYTMIGTTDLKDEPNLSPEPN